MTEQPYNVGQLLLEAAERHEDRPLVTLAGSSLSYRRLADLAMSFAIRLRERGVDRRSLVAIHTSHLSVAFGAYVAVALLGARWVSATRLALNGQLGITHLLHDSDVEMPKRDGIIEIDRSWAVPPAGSRDFPGYASPEDTWFIAQSSGTTGTPKFMEFSYRGFMGRVPPTEAVRLPGGPEILKASLPGPVLAYPSLSSLVALALSGGEGFMGVGYADLRRAGATVVSGTPIQHVHVIRDAEPPPETGRIPVAAVYGAKPSREFLDLLRRYYTAFAVYYGTTEAGMLAIRTVPADGGYDDDLGPPLPGVSVQTVDETDRPVQPGREGIIRVRTPLMIERYLNDREASKRSLRDGWFYPGDTGVLSKEGTVRVTGRIDDLISVGGGKVSALLIDAALESLDSVRDGIAFTEFDANGVQMPAVVVSLREGVDPPDAAVEIRDAIGKALGAVVAPRNVYVADDIPRNENGKATRNAAGEMVAAWARY